MKTHYNITFLYELCQSTFSTKSDLSRNKKTHSNITFVCKICNSNFSTKSHLLRHNKTHGKGNAKHKCKFCNKEFSRKDNLNQHLRSHDTSEQAKAFRKGQAARKALLHRNKNCFKEFHNSVKHGPIFICVCCHQKHFETNVKVLPDDFEETLDIKFPGLYEKSIYNEDNYIEKIKVDKDGTNAEYNYISHICQRYLNKGNLPPMSYKNGLGLYDTDKHGDNFKIKGG